MHDEPEIGLVVPHPQRRRSDQRLQLIRAQRILEALALARLQPTRVRRNRYIATVDLLNHRGQPLRVGDR